MLKKMGLALLALLLAVPAYAFHNTVAVSPVVQLAAYATGNALGGLQTVPIFTANSRYDGRLSAVWVANKAAQVVTVTLFIFDKSPTASTCTDKAAFVLGAADVDKLAFAPMTLTPAAGIPGTTIAVAQNLIAHSMRNRDAPLTPNIYMCAVVGGAVTPASVSDYVIKLNAEVE